MSDNVKQPIEETIINIVAQTLRINKELIEKNSKFVDDLGADSLDLVELMMALEEKFDCEIPDEEASQIATIDDAIKYVEAKTQQ